MTSLVFHRSTNPQLVFGPRLCRMSLHITSSIQKRSKTTFANVSSETVVHHGIRGKKWNSLQRRCFADVTVVTSDEKYGNKEVISVTPVIYDYLLTNVTEPSILQELREETATMRGSQMQVSPDQAQLLAMLVQILGAKRCIEVGVYTNNVSDILTCRTRYYTTVQDPIISILETWILLFPGYSSLAVALVLPESGYLLACERDAVSLKVAKKYYDKAGVTHKVDVKHGLAAEILQSLIQNGETCSFDFAFVDADKRMYQDYFELLLQLVRVGGLIVIDNVLWHGKVANPLINDKKTVSIRNFNRSLMEDKRVSISMVPIGDGMTIYRKL